VLDCDGSCPWNKRNSENSGSDVPVQQWKWYLAQHFQNSHDLIYLTFELVSLATSIFIYSLISTVRLCSVSKFSLFAMLCYMHFLVFLESIFSFSVVNAKITMCSESSEGFTQKEENTVIVQRLFHISTWTSTHILSN